MPQGLTAWQNRLIEKKLPIRADTRKALLDILDREQLSSSNCSKPILNDPGIACAILRETNSPRDTSGHRRINSIGGSIPLLGVPKIRSCIENTPVLEQMALPRDRLAGYLRTSGEACHGAFHARFWAEERKVLELEATQTATLLQGIAELALWCYGDDEMLRIEHACYYLGQDYEQAAQEVLGCSLRELGHALAQSWCLPELVTDALASDLKGHTLATGTALAAQLGRLSGHQWYGVNMRDCMEQVAAYIGKKPGEIEIETHRLALKFSDRFKLDGFRLPAALLPLIEDDTYADPFFRYEPNTAAAPVPAPKPAQTTELKSAHKPAPPPEKPANLATPMPEVPDVSAPKTNTETPADPLSPYLSKVEQAAAQGVPVQEMVRLVSEAMIKGMGLKRAVFSMLSQQKDTLVGRFNQCAPSAPELNQFHISLEQSKLFKILLNKPQAIFVREESQAKYLPLISAQTKTLIGTDSFYAMSIFVGPKPIGMMYADNYHDPLNHDDYRHFQSLCKLLGKGITQSTRKRGR